MTKDGIPKLLLDVREASAALSISPRTLWSLTSPRGPIPAVRLPGRVLYSRAALERWIAEAEQAGGGPGDD
ncbi:MAG: helix-turn-helix domain-containing protein [Planctomycetia bacterium]|nr:helix-turn-helix domain-containing protein [Planctomycetia bacterium]